MRDLNWCRTTVSLLTASHQGRSVTSLGLVLRGLILLWDLHDIAPGPVRDLFGTATASPANPSGPARDRTRTGPGPVWDWRDVSRHSDGTCTISHQDRSGTTLGLARRRLTLPRDLHDITPGSVQDYFGTGASLPDPPMGFARHRTRTGPRPVTDWRSVA
ncbi:hypothetical protein QAD02_002809 [Eretmocerus hayati]|uniref:Uncharacterized protein n=1 Tax=Eretmocerus hayati TaxID=131215 RepID=A0ACC2NPV3_9HYME|nr:hypothetical protein QAD02_002809 [Eretmocerus hayati]